MISARLLPLASLLLAAAIFGFFYAWVCSTMWGLDAADPAIAIQAMQAMNASVRNAVFFPAFFLTPWFWRSPPPPCIVNARDAPESASRWPQPFTQPVALALPRLSMFR